MPHGRNFIDAKQAGYNDFSAGYYKQLRGMFIITVTRKIFLHKDLSENQLF